MSAKALSGLGRTASTAAVMEQVSAERLAVALLKNSKIDRDIGKQLMQKAVLEWAVANADKLMADGILDSLIWVLTSSRDEST